ncbi:MAG: xanthine dehydrogenase family protein [Candidatus Cloacimonetes bacterium]|nr:xanthine dehydrogenase family protein [Candidatus Cloacimonadota bacterium]
MSKAWRNDGYAKVTGKARYTDDLLCMDVLHCVPVYTDFVHAKLHHIHTGKAEKMAGVKRVITHKDILGTAWFGQIFQDYFMLATDTIRCNGDVVALVVAASRQEAIAAAKAVEVVAEELPALTNPLEALDADAILVHQSKGSNLINHHKIRRGAPTAAWQECDTILERDYETAPVEHAYLEPEAALCIPRDDGVMEVHGSMQHPFSTRRFVAAILGTTLANVEVITNPMGGGFGGKDDTAAIVCARAALAAHLCGKPVKITYTREWSMRESYKRHPYHLHYKIGLKGTKIHAVECRIIADGGAYTSVTPWVTWRSTVQCCGVYTVPHVHADVYGVHTNNVFTGAFRGFGSPQVNFAVEQWIDECAAAVKMDPVRFREANMLRQNSVTITNQRLDSHIVSTAQVLDAVVSESDFANKVSACSYGKGEKLYGIGLALVYRGCSLGAEGMDFCSAIINAQFDGSILLDVGIHENGQGAESAMILLLEKHLGVTRERVRYNRPSTSHIPDGGTTVASRGTLMGGGAVMNAIRRLKEIIATALHAENGCAKEDVSFHDDRIWFGADSLSWEEAMKQMYLARTYPFAFGSFAAPRVSWNEETGEGDAYFSYVYSCQAVDLEIDAKTKNVKLLHVWAAHDIGSAVNPQMLKGQIYGGIMQGAGMALWEDLHQQAGCIQAKNFHTYRIPRTTDVPKIHISIIENDDPTSPSGAKGIGEPALELIAPAIANAVYRATGKRINSYPIQPKLKGMTL